MKRTMILTCLALIAVATVVSAQEPLAEIERMLAAGKNAEARVRAEDVVKQYPNASMAWFLLARARHADGDLDGTIEAGLQAVKFPGVRASSYYNLACAYAIQGRTAEALDALDDAKRSGFSDANLMRTDPDLASVRDDPRFVLPTERRYEILDVGDSVGLPYSIDLPRDFDPAKAYPVLIGPGDAEPVPGQAGSIYWGEDAMQRGWIVVESPAFISDAPVDKTRALIDYIAENYKVEGDKFHIAGFSANSAGAFLVTMAMPERFHSVSGLPGVPMVQSESELESLKGVIVNMIVGENDATWLAESRLAHERLRRIGVESYLEVVPNDGHVIEGMFGGEFMDRLDALRKTQ